MKLQSSPGLGRLGRGAEQLGQKWLFLIWVVFGGSHPWQGMRMEMGMRMGMGMQSSGAEDEAAPAAVPAHRNGFYGIPMEAGVQ